MWIKEKEYERCETSYRGFRSTNMYCFGTLNIITRGTKNSGSIVKRKNTRDIRFGRRIQDDEKSCNNKD